MPNSLPQIPDTLYRRLKQIHGEAAGAWLEKLPQLMTQLFDEYCLSFVKEMENLSYNWVMIVRDEVSEYALKLSPPNQEFSAELTALEQYKGKGAAKVLAACEVRGFILLERLMPGETLDSVIDEQEAVIISSKIMQKLWVKPDPNMLYLSVEHWLKGFERYLDASESTEPCLDLKLCTKAMMVGQSLVNTTQEQVLLHADLHHSNILSHGKDWKAIDPKGIIGDKAYEVGAFMRNPFPGIAMDNDLIEILECRSKWFSQHLSLSHKRILDWSFVQAMLAAVWFVEEHRSMDAHRMQDIARAVLQISKKY